MHSSTSSFKTEWKVLAVVLVVLGVCECWARLAASGLDYDRAHIAEFPAISRKLHQSESPRVLFLGNSLTMHGVVLDEVRAELDRRGGPQCTIDRTVPVATDVTDWIYLYERYFRNVDQTPDIVVVGFVRHHVKDLKPPKRLRRLGRHFLALSDMPECFAMDIPGFDERAELLLSRYSALFGDQLIYRENVLYSLLPDFKASEKRLNRILTRVQETAAKDQEQTPPTFERIGRLAKLVKDTGARGVFVAMPLPDIWDTDPQVEQAIKEMGMTYIDARKIDGITPEDFPDGYHMGEKAKLIYSRFIAARLAEQLNIDIN